MIYFVIRVLVNALALALTIIISPGLELQQLLPGVVGISPTYLIFGILFGIMQLNTEENRDYTGYSANDKSKQAAYSRNSPGNNCHNTHKAHPTA